MDQDYDPIVIYRPKKSKISKCKSKQQAKLNKNSNKWNLEQNQKFLEFVIAHKELVICPLKRRQFKIFVLMSKIIQTRSTDQCRSHHQKMIKHYIDVQGIIEHFELKLSQATISQRTDEEFEVYKQMTEEIFQKQQIKNLQQNLEIPIKIDDNIQVGPWDILNQDIFIKKPFPSILNEDCSYF